MYPGSSGRLSIGGAWLTTFLVLTVSIMDGREPENRQQLLKAAYHGDELRAFPIGFECSKEQVERNTGGAASVHTFPAERLGPENQIPEMTRLGAKSRGRDQVRIRVGFGRCHLEHESVDVKGIKYTICP